MSEKRFRDLALKALAIIIAQLYLIAMKRPLGDHPSTADLMRFTTTLDPSGDATALIVGCGACVEINQLSTSRGEDR